MPAYAFRMALVGTEPESYLIAMYPGEISSKITAIILS